MQVKVEGIEELKRKVAKVTPPGNARIMRDFFDGATALVARRAQAAAPKGPLGKSGRLKKTHVAVDPAPVPGWGEVGVGEPFAIYVHEGTGPAAGRKAYFPNVNPGSELHDWAQAQGADPFLVGRAIQRKGTEPRPWLKEAAEASIPEINRLVDGTAKKIEEAFSNG